MSVLNEYNEKTCVNFLAGKYRHLYYQICITKYRQLKDYITDYMKKK